MKEAPTQPAVGDTDTVIDDIKSGPGSQVEYSPMGWGSMQETPTQPATGHVDDEIISSKLTIGTRAEPNLMSSPAVDGKQATKRKKGRGDEEFGMRRRRISINEMCMSPNFRAMEHISSGTTRVRSQTWNESTAIARPKKTPKYRKYKKAVQVEPNHPLISQAFTAKAKEEIVKDPRA